MKKLLLVNGRLGTGGAERVMASLAGKFVDNGYDVDIVLFCSEDEPQYECDERVRIHCLCNETEVVDVCMGSGLGLKLRNIRRKIINTAPIKKLYNIFPWILCVPTLFLIDRTKTRPLREYLNENKVDAIISFLPEPNIATIRAVKHLPIKIIISERITASNCNVSDRIKWLRQRIYPKCDACIFQTQEIMDCYRADIRKKSSIIPNPLKENLPDPYKGSRQKIITNYCRFNVQKNIPLLIRAFAGFHEDHPDWKLRIYGSGDAQPYIELAEKLGVSSSVGIMPFDSDIHNTVREYGMFVSTSDFEGMSNSMLEAMAIGLPTICTDCEGGGAREIIEDHVNGLLVPINDVDAVSRAMSEIADDNILAQRLSENAIKIRERLNIDKITKQWIEVIEQ